MVSSGGTSQVTRGDVEYNGTDNVGLAVDSLPNLFVPSNTSDDQTAIDLSVKWNGSAEHAAVATATYDNAGLTSYIVLTFKDFAAHTVAAYSPATADVTSITNTGTGRQTVQVVIPPGVTYLRIIGWPTNMGSNQTQNGCTRWVGIPNDGIVNLDPRWYVRGPGGSLGMCGVNHQ
jgi:hypothetical protein